MLESVFSDAPATTTAAMLPCAFQLCASTASSAVSQRHQAKSGSHQCPSGSVQLWQFLSISPTPQRVSLLIQTDCDSLVLALVSWCEVAARAPILFSISCLGGAWRCLIDIESHSLTSCQIFLTHRQKGSSGWAHQDGSAGH